ncbi:hypothetical protein [Apilactobacillus apinorum]|uniref:baeRF3 domain-containing protein n=1 Tax=Apilactobacillus apinorum TaxID=1218495 RepID=UPI0006B5DF10|nr:hypothetical protein [Apilactobacillus apinorum]KOY68061.1 hypothetical protein RZ74_12970 [Apilactobacillus apinorum]CAI2695425.1 Hypothetical protein AAPFHON13_14030 [Apilactobacillus apinorum]
MTSTIELRNTLTLDYEVGPFISLFVSFNEISNKNEYLNLIDKIKDAFTAKHDEIVWPRYERKLRRFNFDRAKHIGNGTGVAIYVSFKAIHSFDLAQPVKTQLSIEDTMNISQLVKEIQSQLHYHVLALFDDEFKVFRVDNGNFSVVNTPNKPLSVLVDNDKEKYFKLVDEYVKELFGDDNYLPTVIVANDENRQLFTQLTTLKNFSKDISYNFNDKNIDAEKLNDIIEHFNQSFLNKLAEDNNIKYESASSKHQVATDLRDIISNAISGKIDTLYISEDAYDKTLNDLAITTIGFAGEVIILPKKQMPMHLDIAAITLKF